MNLNKKEGAFRIIEADQSAPAEEQGQNRTTPDQYLSVTNVHIKAQNVIIKKYFPLTASERPSSRTSQTLTGQATTDLGIQRDSQSSKPVASQWRSERSESTPLSAGPNITSSRTSEQNVYSESSSPPKLIPVDAKEGLFLGMQEDVKTNETLLKCFDMEVKKKDFRCFMSIINVLRQNTKTLTKSQEDHKRYTVFRPYRNCHYFGMACTSLLLLILLHLSLSGSVCNKYLNVFGSITLIMHLLYHTYAAYQQIFGSDVFAVKDERVVTFDKIKDVICINIIIPATCVMPVIWFSLRNDIMINNNNTQFESAYIQEECSRSLASYYIFIFTVLTYLVWFDSALIFKNPILAYTRITIARVWQVLLVLVLLASWLVSLHSQIIHRSVQPERTITYNVTLHLRADLHPNLHPFLASFNESQWREWREWNFRKSFLPEIVQQQNQQTPQHFKANTTNIIDVFLSLGSCSKRPKKESTSVNPKLLLTISKLDYFLSLVDSKKKEHLLTPDYYNKLSSLFGFLLI